MSYLDRALACVDRWQVLCQSKIKQTEVLTAEVESLKLRVGHYRNKVEHYRDRFTWALRKIHDQRIEIAKSEIPYPKAASELEQQKEFLQRQCNESFEKARLANVQIDQKDAEITRLRGVVSRLQDRLSFQVYNAQNELELLRTIRQSQGEAITKLRHSLTEACQERDAASHRANAWREDYNQSEQDRVVAQEGLAQARRANQGLDRDRQKLYQKIDCLQRALNVSQAVNRIVARREANNPRLEMILEESHRNEFKRNIDNQKSHEAPNCQSS